MCRCYDAKGHVVVETVIIREMLTFIVLQNVYLCTGMNLFFFSPPEDEKLNVTSLNLTVGSPCYT